MDYQLVATIVISLSVAIGYLNERFIQKESSIIIVLTTILIVIALYFLDAAITTSEYLKTIDSMLNKVSFSDFLLSGILSFLLFAGSLHIDLSMLKEKKSDIFILATLSTLASTFIIAYASHYLLIALNSEIPFLYCLLLGSLISPTDPIAVLSMLKELNAPKDVRTTIAGESLFNDGIGIVVFITLYSLINDESTAIDITHVLLLFIRQVVGGITIGVILGYFGYKMINSCQKNIPLCVMISIWIVTAGYTICEHYLGVSAPIAMVVSGIFIGNKGNTLSLPKAVNIELHQFWYIIDELLNSLLFLFVGLECLLLGYEMANNAILALLMIPIVLLARLIAVAIPISLLSQYRQQPFNQYLVGLITWGGLRGGLSIALALSLPQTNERDIIFCITYAVVIFSIVVQGLTIKPLFELSKKHLPTTHAQ